MADPVKAKLMTQMQRLADASKMPLPPGRTVENIATTTLQGLRQAGLLVVDPASLNDNLNYRRYEDDPHIIDCRWAKSDMTPCAARDGAVAVYAPPDDPRDVGRCVGCRFNVADLFRDLVREVTGP